MNISTPFIRRPIGTTLLAIGLFLVGVAAYIDLPVASLPSIDFPTIRINAVRPGADPATMAATVAAPLERRLGEIAGVNQITSSSTLGATSLSVVFDLDRDIDSAAREVQAAINAASADLPSDLPNAPTYRKANPTASPVLILALTSDTMTPGDVYDLADSVIAQRISRVPGVADVAVSGASQPAIRVQVDPAALASMGLGMEDVRRAIDNASAMSPVGRLDGPDHARILTTNGQLSTPDDYAPIVVKSVDGTVTRLSSIASVEQGVRDTQSAAWFNGKSAVLLIITRQADANVIATIDGVHEAVRNLQGWIPAGVEVSVLADRAQTIRASVQDMQVTLGIAVALVTLVVFLFLRRIATTIAAGVTIPLSLAGACALMWLAGYSIDNLSLMALAVSAGFVIDDAIVVIENIFRKREAGTSILRSAVEGARQVGFTVVAINLSLIAAFIPLLFMSGIIGRMFREFSVTLACAIAVSTIVSLSVTPMICAHFIDRARRPPGRLEQRIAAVSSAILRGYDISLRFVLRHHLVTLAVFVAILTGTVVLYAWIPKGYFPRDDTGLIVGAIEASADTSFETLSRLQQQAASIVRADPAVAGIASSAGTNLFRASASQGRIFISLKPLSERRVGTHDVANRLRRSLAKLPGIKVYMTPSRDVRVGGRRSKSLYQVTLWSPDFAALRAWAPRVEENIRRLPGFIDVTNDTPEGGLQAKVEIDRQAAARLGVDIQAIDDALNNSYAQRQVSTIYTERNQYRVVLETDPRFQRDPSDFDKVFVTGADGTRVPLSSVATVRRTSGPSAVNHQRHFPAITITYNLRPRFGLDYATTILRDMIADMNLPDRIHAEFAGEAKAFVEITNSQPFLILAALLAIYIVLGILYESLAHPLTIISTLPPAGLGALLALQMTNYELSIIGFIGIILLLGIVKKNGIMLVDFALERERRGNLPPAQAIHEACIERFRPILMTTLAALLGALPLAMAEGHGAELRRPLGIAIIGGLVASQLLTLYTTPVIYIQLDRLHRRLWGSGQSMAWRKLRPQERA